MTRRFRSRRGYSLLEVIFAMAIFGLFLTVLLTLTAEMRFYEKRLPLNMHKHPQVMAVLSRMRRDVHDSSGYQGSYGTFVASDNVLIVDTIMPNGGQQTVVWDFRTPGEVWRRAYNVGVPDNWVARGLPLEFSKVEIGAVMTGEGAAWAAQIRVTDAEGRLAIDTILQPRATE